MTQSRQTRAPRLRIDGYTRVCLTAITVLLTLLVLGLWAEATPGPRTARAGETLSNPGQQRQQLIDQQKVTNQRLSELIALLRSGEVKVALKSSDQDKEASRGSSDSPAQPKP